MKSITVSELYEILRKEITRSLPYSNGQSEIKIKQFEHDSIRFLLAYGNLINGKKLEDYNPFRFKNHFKDMINVIDISRRESVIDYRIHMIFILEINLEYFKEEVMKNILVGGPLFYEYFTEF